MVKYIINLTVFFLLLITNSFLLGQVYVVSFHDIPNPDNMTASSDTAPNNFNDMMNFLKRQNYNVVPLLDIVHWIEGSVSLPTKAIGLATDDNYIGGYQNAYPILVSHQFYTTFFVHTYYVGKVTSKDHADWIELQEMEDSGYIDIESHTYTHPDLTSLSPSDLQYQLTKSKADIESNLTDKVCRLIAYPGGAYNGTVITECINAGYEAGFRASGGANYGSEPLFEINRVFCDNNSTLKSFKSLIGFIGSDPNGPIIIDNVDSEFTTTGSWSTDNAVLQKYGTNYRFTSTATTPTASAKFTPSIPQAGSYKLYAWWTLKNQMLTSVEYQIQHSGGTSTIYKNQQINGGRWNLLGEYNLSVGTSNYISVSNVGATGNTVVADAVKFESATTDVSNWELY